MNRLRQILVSCCIASAIGWLHFASAASLLAASSWPDSLIRVPYPLRPADEAEKRPTLCRYPFSFLYGTLHSDELLPTWQTQTRSERIDIDRTRTVTTCATRERVCGSNGRRSVSPIFLR